MTHLEFFLLWRNTKSNGAVMEAVCALNMTALEISVNEAVCALNMTALEISVNEAEYEEATDV